jgi:hypothetical protein
MFPVGRPAVRTTPFAIKNNKSYSEMLLVGRPFTLDGPRPVRDARAEPDPPPPYPLHRFHPHSLLPSCSLLPAPRLRTPLLPRRSLLLARPRAARHCYLLRHRAPCASLRARSPCLDGRRAALPPSPPQRPRTCLYAPEWARAAGSGEESAPPPSLLSLPRSLTFMPLEMTTAWLR